MTKGEFLGRKLCNSLENFEVCYLSTILHVAAKQMFIGT